MSIRSIAQTDYINYQQLTSKLKNLQTKYPTLAKLTSLTKTEGGYDIWNLTLSKGDPGSHPGIAIVGGVDGSRVLTVEMALQMAEQLLAEHSEVLAKTTFYIFPNMSPKASENYHEALKYERLANSRSTDDDRDGQVDEDPFEDLNKDGLITLVRVEDPTGDYVKLDEDERIMVKADAEKGQMGGYKVYTEGIDNDYDGEFNEDGPGGVNFNKNLTFDYPYFTPGAGEHAVSEKEHRALLDFLYDQWNLYAILTLGPSNNLSSPLKYTAGKAKKRVVTSILKDDEVLNKYLSKKYNDLTETKDAPKYEVQQGGFFEWSYFHFGRLAMSTPGWWPPKFKGDSLVKAAKHIEANFLQWAAKEEIPSYFVEWTPVEHPNFPGKKVEVGGIAPYVMFTPPYSMVKDISKKHTDFIVAVAEMQAEIKLENVTVENVNNGLTRITVQVHNKGFLPTHTEMGQRSRWLQKIMVTLKLRKGQEVISGKKTQLIGSLPGDGSETFTWLIKGNGKVEISAGAAHTGIDKTTVNLK
ncbi:M14 family metallopeptidase [Flavobacteriaceae bacterium F08102]|nr:M14 family metallopeptidase [Flavobacteriaceae bacterium F08102]